VKLRHATPRKNLPGIVRDGLLCSKSKGKRKAVWLCKPARCAWALLHVARRHRCHAEAVVVLEVDVPRRWLRRHAGGVYYSLKDIPPERCRRLIVFAEMASAVPASA
jgi:hypothetical protein